MTRPNIKHDATIEEIAASLGLTASDWRTDLPEVTFDDEDISPRQVDGVPPPAGALLTPAEIIDELQKLGQTVPAAHPATQACIKELQIALRLVSGREEMNRGGWRIQGLPNPLPTPTEKAERMAMLLGQAFTIAASLPSLCEEEEGYDEAVLGRVEASLERWSDSPETFQDAVHSEPAKAKSAEDQAINH